MQPAKGKGMKDSKLQFDRSCHVLYSGACKKEIQAKIALHYPETEREAVWERVQLQYVEFLSDWRTDLGGSKNFHNGAGGTYAGGYQGRHGRAVRRGVRHGADQP